MPAGQVSGNHLLKTSLLRLQVNEGSALYNPSNELSDIFPGANLLRKLVNILSAVACLRSVTIGGGSGGAGGNSVSHFLCVCVWGGGGG